MKLKEINQAPRLRQASPRGRLAPSPTGYLHIGGHARTFYTAFERARQSSGTLVLRMEDLDPDRSRDVYADAAIEADDWLGLSWKEGPYVGGPVRLTRRTSDQKCIY